MKFFLIIGCVSLGMFNFVKVTGSESFSLILQPKLLVGELIDIAASHFNLREKEYFGIWYLDSM